MPDLTYQPAIRHDQGGNRITYGNGATLKREAGSTFLTEVGNGTAGIGVLTERLGQLHHTTITLTNYVMATVDATTNGAQGTGVLYNFPRGFIQIIGASSNVAIVGDGVNITATAALIMAVGTAVAAADVTLTSTEANIIASTACTLAASAGVFKGKAVATPVNIDNSTTTNATNMTANLNAVVPDAGSSANGTLTLTGTIELFWYSFGDN